MATIESRKRARTEDGEGVRAKKRAVTEERNSPGSVVGTTTNAITSNEADEPKDNDSLEMFRKDAIYRRMKHYSRENERSQAKIAELERRRHTCEAGLAALGACWSQIVDTIHSLVRPEDLPPLDIQTQEIYDLSAHVSSDPDPTYVDSLRSKMHATQQLVTAFVQLGGGAQAILSGNEIYTECQRAQTQCSTLRSEMTLMRTKLKSSESEKERLQEELTAAHTRIDRLQSKAVAALHSTSKSSPSPENGSGNGEVKKDEGSPTPSSPSPATPAAPINGIHAVLEVSSSTPGKDDIDEKPTDIYMTVDDRITEYKAIADLRERNIQELQQECIDLRAKNLVLQNPTLSPEAIKDSAMYSQLHLYTREFVLKEEMRQKELATCREEVDTLTKERQQWETELRSTNDKIVSELKATIDKKQADLLRIREQRDQMQSELNERKQRDIARLASLNEWRLLAEARGERININSLLNRVTRLKTRLAAEAGDADLMAPDVDPESLDVSYVQNLRSKLCDAEVRVAALESTLSKFSDSHPEAAVHARAEAEAVQRAAKFEKRVREFESVFGHGAKDDAARRLGEEVKKLRLAEKQREQTEKSFDDEMSTITSAWEIAEKLGTSKVLDLVAMEEKISRAQAEKAKMETKYYTAVRERDAIENEKKTISRNHDKQAKLIETLCTNETNYKARLNTYDSQEKHLKELAEKARILAQVAQDDLESERARIDSKMKWIESLRSTCTSYDQEVEKRRTQLMRKEESIKKKELEAERILAKAKEKFDKAALSLSSNASTREAELIKEVEQCMTLLQCSTCKSNMRTTIITKCMHTFCKPCVDSRIASRQRKCPACNISFSQGEVQQLYLQ
ncbi:E3 ubiquitin-protein ligase bre1 [Steccherinum ochraceum]|uniref:E3 ubiquitin protein ligase n=1 Tax=Steccherinum ochraceum TaxID=92696 RepID=A0A4R0R751_9APHY|nr:E3 ubiquitin-protein ligase bre1 [Steccherinum ochraceum]